MVSRFFTIQLPEDGPLNLGRDNLDNIQLREVRLASEEKEQLVRDDGKVYGSVTMDVPKRTRITLHVAGFWSTFAVSYTLIIFCMYMLITKDKCDSAEYMSLLSTCIAIWVPSPSHVFEPRLKKNDNI
jgi:hypothetical protein